MELKLTLPERVENRLKNVAKRVGAEDITELVKRALASYDTLTEMEARGATFWIKTKDEPDRQFSVTEGKVVE